MTERFAEKYFDVGVQAPKNFKEGSDLLKRVTVRIVIEEERAKFDQLLEERHYLEYARLSGQTLRYVAELDGQWVALICFGAAALHLKSRDQEWIRWSPRQRARRLHFVVNNSRFPVLPQRQSFPNLASKVMGLCLRRLSSDWQECWGHPVLAVEKAPALSPRSLGAIISSD